MDNISFLDSPVSNPEVVKLMKAVREEQSSENMLALLKAAAMAEFVVPISINDGRYGFHAVKDKKDRQFIVAYTDTVRFETAQVDSGNYFKAVKASFADLTEVVMAENMKLDGFILNPGSGEVLFGKEMLEMIYRQMNGGDAKEGSDSSGIRIGDSDHYPPRFGEMMTEFSRNDDRISRVYVKLAQDVSSGDQHWLLIIESDAQGDERKYLYETFGKFMRSYADGLGVMCADINDDIVKNAGTLRVFWEKK
ncbi:MAG: SseB family protein [Clostridiales bacterium]|nr:SseB family protein [Clostridiales bacterium]